ncbi:FG-GAP repeat domain-containing protein [Streptomyces sp. NRRL F-5630]|uniref:FG-GAP repeat domain-containing protein n=1 Tax=Streptomyces sp. NRRL F-5630 TaxID=1463864 RepID=UPI003EB72E08
MRVQARLFAGTLAGALLLGACGTGGGEPDAHGAKARTPGTPRAGALPSAPPARQAPAPGKGSKDPDDLNGDGRTDLSLVLPAGKPKATAFPPTRFATLYGGAHGPDPATRTALGREALGLRAGGGRDEPPGAVPADLVTADLDGDGFPDVVSTDTYRENAERGLSTGDFANQRGVPFVTWGGPAGPRGAAKALRTDPALSVSGVRRGDFDGDGHPDLAVYGDDASLLHGVVAILYGPFTRDGSFARTERITFDDGVGGLAVAPLDPGGAHTPTPLFVHDQDDGEQTAGTLYRGGPGKALFAGGGERTRKGNAYTFGDFDGDGVWDLATGDDGSRNDEPGHGTEAPGTEGSYAIHPGEGPTTTHRLPKNGTGVSATLRTFLAADPDGDGKDVLLLDAPDGPVLADPVSGEPRPVARRSGPADHDGKKIRKDDRGARPLAARDLDGDGKDEILLGWGPGTAGGGNRGYVYLWVVRPGDDTDMTAFTALGVTAAGSAGE